MKQDNKSIFLIKLLLCHYVNLHILDLNSFLLIFSSFEFSLKKIENYFGSCDSKIRFNSFFSFGCLNF